jgi:hypothetical protein
MEEYVTPFRHDGPKMDFAHALLDHEMEVFAEVERPAKDDPERT